VTGMHRIALWVMSTVTVLVLLFSYHTSTSSQLAAGSSAVAPSSGFSTSTGSTGTTSGTGTTVTGPVASTRWGPVQVQLTVADGSLTGVTVLQYPNGNGRDQEINDYALPILVQETLDAQSAQIDMVSGATVTSEGYLESLQSALDEAGL
jgi:uncharacterized protein with FMN-binding domain